MYLKYPIMEQGPLTPLETRNLGQREIVEKAGVGLITGIIIIGSLFGLWYYLEPHKQKPSKIKYHRTMTKVKPLPR